MANAKQLAILKQGREAWNTWRQQNPAQTPDLRQINFGAEFPKGSVFREFNFAEADLTEARFADVYLSKANFDGANLNHASLDSVKMTGASLIEATLKEASLKKTWLITADLSRADLSKADLRGALLNSATLRGTIFRGAQLQNADLSQAFVEKANLTKANLSRVDLRWTDLSGTNLTEANLAGANLGKAVLAQTNISRAFLAGTCLERAILVEANIDNAILRDCYVYGISVWDVKGKPREHTNLIITRFNEPALTVDDLEVAQFIYLLVNYPKLRDIIDTVTSKVVLILGRFTKKRLATLKVIQEGLRNYKDQKGRAKYIPVVFDFERSASRDLTETVRTLAHLSRFIIADVTSAKGVLQELQAVVPELEVPVQLLLEDSPRAKIPGMLVDDTKYPWVIKEVYCYRDSEDLRRSVKEYLIEPCERMLAAMKQSKPRLFVKKRSSSPD